MSRPVRRSARGYFGTQSAVFIFERASAMRFGDFGPAVLPSL